MIAFRRMCVWLMLASGLQAGILVTRAQQGFRFAEAVSISVNGKDKVLNLGSDPKVGDRLGKLPSVRPVGALLLEVDSGVMAEYVEGAVNYLLPEGMARSVPGDAMTIWKSAPITYRRSASDKTPTAVAITEFVAFLPEGPLQLTRCAMDGRALELIGGKTKVLDTQLALVAAAVKAYPAEQSVALEKFVELAMQRRYDSFESGTAGLDTLQEALRFAQLSADIYPKQPKQMRLRESLAVRKAWLDRRAAIVKAFAAVRDWDALLTGDHDESEEL
jgi:hypothetical protein